jgi:class 3 adenylate cyclase
VNIAQRLEQLGKELDDGKSEVIALISAATAAILSPGIAATSAGRLQLRGHGEAIELFRLI